jgi:hypothetical protein
MCDCNLCKRMSVNVPDMHKKSKCIGLAKTIYIQYVNGIFGRKMTI